MHRLKQRVTKQGMVISNDDGVGRVHDVTTGLPNSYRNYCSV
ncbi:Uncharacterised protein [Vibrio cholerae]|nr:Uncharacterised protein [Vibrio cholerae]CSI92399.1 Uncharacterised protein [Vibrio cholerae]